MADANKRKRDDGIFDWAKFVELTLYECMFSAQFTANIQILFRIEDIVLKLPPGNFAAAFPDHKQQAHDRIHLALANWKKNQDPNVAAFFDAHDLTKAKSVVFQKNTVTAVIDEKTVKLNSKDANVECIVAAIELLRYPLQLMENVQRGRTCRLLDLETDAPMISKMFDTCPTEAQRIHTWLRLLNGKKAKGVETATKK